MEPRLKHIVFATLAVLLLSGCGTARKVVENKTETTDSVKVEVRYEKIIEKDTVLLEIPKIVEKNVTKEKHSHLENEYATSDASVDSTGLLHHSLETKAQKKPVPVETETERRDSIIYKERKVFVETPVMVERDLSWWQKTQIYGFRVLLAAAVLLLIYKNRGRLLGLFRRIILP